MKEVATVNHVLEGVPALTRFNFDKQVDREFLQDHGFLSFDDFWSLPQVFVDDINYRRGGWSGVSKISLWNGESQRVYYVKRQENQFRYSLKKPFRALTFEFEANAITRNLDLNLPAIDIACVGVRQQSNSTKGLLVTSGIDLLSLEDILARQKFTNTLGILLTRCGEQLLEMHSHGIQHGALYPKHLFIDQRSGIIKLIDFERARKKNSVPKAIQSDLRQLLKPLRTLPFEVTEMLVRPYQLKHSKLISKLKFQLKKAHSA